MKFSTNIQKALLVAAFSGSLLFTSCGDSSSSSKTYQIERTDPTMGVITYMQEVSTNEFKITDEKVIPATDSSMAIITNLDKTVDTLMLADIKVTKVEEGHPQYYRSSGISSVLYGGLMGYWMGRSMSSPIMAGSYMNQNTYQKVNNSSAQTMKKSAATTRSTRPSSSSKGYGKSSSSRSYGG